MQKGLFKLINMIQSSAASGIGLLQALSGNPDAEKLNAAGHWHLSEHVQIEQLAPTPTQLHTMTGYKTHADVENTVATRIPPFKLWYDSNRHQSKRYGCL